MAKAAKKAAKKSEKTPAKKVVKKEAIKPEVKVPAKKKAEPIAEEPVEIKNVEAQVSPENEVPCPEPELGSTEFDEMLIKEIMVQKNVTRLSAIDILRDRK